MALDSRSTLVHGTLALLLAGGAVFGACSSPRAEHTAEPPAPAVRPADVAGLEAALAAHWRAAGVTPVDEADDAELVRRVYLDLVGRIPDATDAASYADDRAPDKLATLVDRLLASPEHAEHFADLWSDVLLGGATKVQPRVRDELHAWLREQIGDDRPWDEVARAVLTANGSGDAPSPAAFVLVHGRKGRVEGVTGQTARVFLGLQIQCAECHDHPLDDRWTQRGFYELAAYWAHTRVRIDRGGDAPTVRIVDRARGEMRMPAPEDAPGDRTGALVEPRFLGAAEGTIAGTRREALAEHVVQSELFAKALANRTWSQLFGRGLVEPVDDLGGPDDPEHGAVLEALAQIVLASDYDLDALVRAIVLSSAYRRSSRGEKDDGGARVRAFAQAGVRPLGPEPLLRSLLLATGVEGTAPGELRRATERRKQAALREVRFLFADDEMAETDAFTGTVPQALMLLHGELTNRGALARPGSTLATVLEKHDDHDERLRALWLALYGRMPTGDERREHLAFVAAQGESEAAWEDSMFAMLVSSEFVTNH